ncbi:sugar transferase [Ruminococcus sp. OA3]|uniref:sugar transferase n=1 Tax=Ruminococcus sp. OA3 TaxID=2914164 RepID=UPI0023DD5E84|nr:sugar transferase [Ruminococcus sp. OA3]
MNKKSAAIAAVIGSGVGSVAYLIRKNAKNKQKKEQEISHKKSFYEKHIKRSQDFCCALLAVLILSPVMAVTAMLVRIKLGSPVIFRQKRPGLHGEIFTLYKFRTMTDERDESGELQSDEVRLTSFGKWLRSTSLDELPELINILKGDMAVVGPRPLLIKYLPYYNSLQARRHEVKPGFTGYAQVHGRNAVTWEEKFDMDVHYVDNISFLGDWKIIFQTVKTVLKREGISSATSATMEDFADYVKIKHMRNNVEV